MSIDWHLELLASTAGIRCIRRSHSLLPYSVAFEANTSTGSSLRTNLGTCNVRRCLLEIRERERAVRRMLLSCHLPENDLRFVIGRGLMRVKVFAMASRKRVIHPTRFRVVTSSKSPMTDASLLVVPSDSAFSVGRDKTPLRVIMLPVPVPSSCLVDGG